MARIRSIWYGKVFYKLGKEDVKITVQADLDKEEQYNPMPTYKQLMNLVKQMHEESSRF